MMDKVSILVAIYNSENYLEQCIESLVKQTYSNIEIILVNDGSTDTSAQICRNFYEGYENIKYIEVENGGCLKARKIGLQNATGNIIAFVDSDDWLEPNTIEHMYRELSENDADIVIAGYFENIIDGEKVIVNAIESGVYKGRALEERIYSQMLCKEDYFSFGITPFLWNKLYRRKVIEKAVLEANDIIGVGEDVVRVYPAILNSNCVCILDKAYYHYRINGNSMSHSYRDDFKEYQNIQLQHACLEEVFKKHPMKDCLLHQLERYIKHHQMVRCLPLFNKLSKKEACFPFQEMEKGSNIVIYGAGAFGVATYNFFMSSMEYNVIGWCDRDYTKYQSLDYEVEDIDVVLNRDFDYIVIAIMNEKIVASVKLFLMQRNITENVIVGLIIV